ncbi:MAG: hypothetical protein AAGB31_02920 [Bdellovibrio sp.]
MSLQNKGTKMFKKSLLCVLSLSAALLSGTAQAMSLDWSGGYRFEWTEVDRPSLATPTERKAYGLNYLYLSPKIIAADGVNIISRFDVLNSTAYPNSQVGEIWGLNTNAAPGNVSNQGSSQVHVSQLYLNVNQEYGALIVGRAPFEFGLGMTYNAGKGPFDHWYDTRDMAAYKIVVGDWFFMPVLSRRQSNGFGQGGTISSMGFQLQYESEENKSLIGVYQENTKGVKEVLGYSASQIAAYGGDSVNSDLNIQSTNFVLGRGFDSFGFKVEAGFQSGEVGVTQGAESVSLNGYGIAAEIYIPRNEGKWDWNFKFGMATGDDPDSTDFGGYAFHRNYDVGMLLFNHRLGQRDFLQTDVNKDASLGVGNSADDESLSNVLYFAPSATYAWSDRLDVRNTLVYGQLLNTVKNSVDSEKDLGIEWDIELVYKPSDRIQWVNQVGLLFPGGAWKNGTSELENGFTFGFASKAAISF